MSCVYTKVACILFWNQYVPHFFCYIFDVQYLFVSPFFVRGGLLSFSSSSSSSKKYMMRTECALKTELQIILWLGNWHWQRKQNCLHLFVVVAAHKIAMSHIGNTCIKTILFHVFVWRFVWQFLAGTLVKMSKMTTIGNLIESLLLQESLEASKSWSLWGDRLEFTMIIYYWYWLISEWSFVKK